MEMDNPKKRYTGFYVDLEEDLYMILEKLRSLGITKKDVVNLALREYFKRGMEQVVKDLAVMKAKELDLIAEKLAEEEEKEKGVE